MSDRWQVVIGDAACSLGTLADASVDAVVTDPPAGIAFMGQAWDRDRGGRDAWVAWMAGVARECLRVLKPGGHALVWALPRTSHWTATAWEDAGFEVRDRIAHVFGSGFPKSADVSKHIDRMAGATRDVVGKYEYPDGAIRVGTAGGNTNRFVLGEFEGVPGSHDVTAPATDDAKKWSGWGTSLKPATEDWWVFRKPLGERTVAANVLRHGTGAINIDACRVGIGSVERDVLDNRSGVGFGTGVTVGGYKGRTVGKFKSHAEGRWPAHLVHDGSAAVEALFPETTGSGAARTLNRGKRDDGWGMADQPGELRDAGSGSAARFFARLPDDDAEDGAVRLLYVPKASKRDRDEGCEAIEQRFLATMGDGIGGREHNRDQPTAYVRNHHPTVKATALMRWLVRLVTPVGGLVVDPFCGSGSTGKAALLEGMRFWGSEQDPGYAEIARARCAHAAAASGEEESNGAAPSGEAADHAPAIARQGDLFGGWQALARLARKRDKDGGTDAHMSARDGRI